MNSNNMKKKYIYTLWTKPLVNAKSLYNNIAYLLLSVHLVKKQASDITIYTDIFGEILIKHFFKDIRIDTQIVSQFDNLQLDRWSIPKLYTINAQKDAHCHIDHDVFLWTKIPEFEEKNDIIVQNIEINGLFPNFYKTNFYRFFENNENIHADLLECLETEDFGGYNCGYIDVYNIDISKQWTDFAIDLNNSFINNFTWDDCTLVEQFTLYFLSKKYNYKIGHITEVDYLSIDSADFSYRPSFNFKYTHLMREKKNPEIINKIEKILQKLDTNLYNKLYDIQHLLLKTD